VQILSIASCLILLGASNAALALPAYKCFGKDAFGQRLQATLVASGNAVIFNGKSASLDLNYRPRGRKDRVRFLFDAGSYGSDLYSSGVLISKEVLSGANKVFLTQEWGGEGYQRDNYVCFAD
jgi:hypothetical protein